MRFAQSHEDIAVHGAGLIVHLDEGDTLTGTTDAVVDEINVDTKPSVTADVAIATARAHALPGLPLSKEARASLAILGRDTLAWKVELESLHHTSTDTMPVVFVDAHAGAVLWQYDALARSYLPPEPSVGFGTTIYDGDRLFLTLQADDTLYYLEDVVRGIATLSYNNTTTSMSWVGSEDNVFSGAAPQAHWAAGEYYDMLADTFNATGIDGANGPGHIASHHPGVPKLLTLAVDFGIGDNNATWNGTYAFFGGGDGVGDGNFASVDIVGHELTHGLVQFTAGLVYHGDSGALNESMADIFGAALEHYLGHTDNEIWWHGEDVRTPLVVGDAQAHRVLTNPNADGHSLDLYSGRAARADVHYSSGIGNLAFALTARGGAHPRFGGEPVVGIGFDEALRIWHLALSFYLLDSATWHDARAATQTAARVLYGDGSTQMQSVARAWETVGVLSCAMVNEKSNQAWRRNEVAYYPSSLGVPVQMEDVLVASLSDNNVMATANLDLYLEIKDDRPKSRFRQVAASELGNTGEDIRYNVTSNGQARWVVKSRVGSTATMELCADIR